MDGNHMVDLEGMGQSVWFLGGNNLWGLLMISMVCG